jgi:leucyl-tRNA synthetase
MVWSRRQPGRRWNGALLVEDTITLPVQVNGKKRADITVARDADNGAIEAAVLSHEAVRRAMEGKPARR